MRLPRHRLKPGRWSQVHRGIIDPSSSSCFFDESGIEASEVRVFPRVARRMPKGPPKALNLPAFPSHRPKSPPPLWSLCASRRPLRVEASLCALCERFAEHAEKNAEGPQRFFPLGMRLRGEGG